MPVGAYAGRREIMETIAPLGEVYQAGTLSGNPVAMAAGMAQLSILHENPQIYGHIGRLGNRLREGLLKIILRHMAQASVSGVGSLSCLFFTPNCPRNYGEALCANRQAYAKYFHYMLSRGIYLPPAQFEALFISNAHTEADIDSFLDSTECYIREENL